MEDPIRLSKGIRVPRPMSGRPDDEEEPEEEEIESEEEDFEEGDDEEVEGDEEDEEGEETEGDGDSAAPAATGGPGLDKMPAGQGRGKYAPRPDEQGYVRVKLPDKKLSELFGVADQLMGGSRLKVMCEDGQSRLARIPGKMKRRMWIREGDLVIVKPWEFQEEKADVVWRYTKTQAQYLARRGMVPKQIDIYND